MPNGLPVQCLSERDFLFPDADEKYVPDVLAYIQSYDFGTFNDLLWTKTPEDVVATFPYLSDQLLLAGAVRAVEQVPRGRVGRPAAAPHAMDGAEKVQRSCRGRYARRF
jgi:hypothetical protein